MIFFISGMNGFFLFPKKISLFLSSMNIINFTYHNDLLILLFVICHFYGNVLVINV